jgi:hypothetical protein
MDKGLLTSFERWKADNYTPPAAKPVYTHPDRERQRLAWIKWRDRLYFTLKAVCLDGGSSRRSNMLMEMVWPFPEDVKNG